ncbi:protein sevenless [Anopheles cruzii]|uniref:protein sevenless n=1 Tax=Anopheles cruzii TaxID=68878 RepID=UPI0022EC7F6B|nr:protein sevenless [Anopheles cruzii]
MREQRQQVKKKKKDTIAAARRRLPMSCGRPGAGGSGRAPTANRKDYTRAVHELVNRCINRCPDQNRTSFTEHIDVSCGNDCYIKQCTAGCQHWEQALESSCQNVCNITNQEFLEARELYCIMGCNDGLNRYFRWLKAEIGTPHAPALVADSLTATALALEWEVPERLLQLSRHRNRGPQSYLVQWRYEEVAGDWKFCRNQSMGDSSTVRVDNLQPYTKYRFRVALLLSPNHDQVLTSEQSVIISTMPAGVPTSKPTIVRAVAVDHSRISISWEPGPFPNGPVLSYVLQIKDLHPIGYSALKDVPESSTSRYYIFEKLDALRNYSVSVAMRNPEGEGPASVTHVSTPPKPSGGGADESPILPTLILGAEHSVLTQSSNLLFSDPPTRFYRSETHKIRGTARHIRRGLIFVSDDAGFIWRAPLRPGAEQDRVAVLSPTSGANFRPTLLSVDWLNDHLYVLGQAHTTQLWQISHCDFAGAHLTVAIAGLQQRPDYFAVDPFNGYLFWVIGAEGDPVAGSGGLFRLDLGDISNGVRHEIRPQQIVRSPHLGAFAIDHPNFRVLVADQRANTMLSVSLDGKVVEDIRNNVQQPRFERVRSLALARGYFYWTNGTDVFAEDYHKESDIYFHNAFPVASNNTYFSISVNLTSEQPIPVPVNPPRHVQALVSPDRLRIAWDPPYLLGVKGKGAWQAWSYRLEVRPDIAGSTVLRVAVVANGSTSYATGLEGIRVAPNRRYVVRVAAHTPAGAGPWSREFRVRTLRTTHQAVPRQLVWASAAGGGIMRSDVIGDNVSSVLPNGTEMDVDAVSGLAWHNGTLYVVGNGTLRLYQGGVRIRELDSVECVALDRRGERLYFHNSAQQMIVRAGLLGDHQEPIHNVPNVRELRFDERRGYLYASSGLLLEAFRLNGKNRVVYFNENLFTGRQIVGMALDTEGGRRLYWIVRSYSASHLYWAPLAGTINGGSIDASAIVTSQAQLSALGDPGPPPQGPLLHFSDRLLWVRDGQGVVGDERGENLAYIRSPLLHGTTALALIEESTPGPGGDTEPRAVLPAAVNRATVRVTGDWRSFNISWAPVDAIGSGEGGDEPVLAVDGEDPSAVPVFYKLLLQVPGAGVAGTTFSSSHELSVPWYAYEGSPLSYVYPLIPPYSLMNVTVHAFTYWRSSAVATVRRRTPTSTPSAPERPRTYLKPCYRPGTYELADTILFRWDTPAHLNGPLVGYRVTCRRQSGVTVDEIRVPADEAELLVEEQESIPNATYSLRVRAINVNFEGVSTAAQTVRLVADGGAVPVPALMPLVYVVTAHQITLFDLDHEYPGGTAATAPLLTVTMPPTAPATLLAELRHERRLFWVDVNGELYAYDIATESRQRLGHLPGHTTALTVDWVGRTLYMATVITAPQTPVASAPPSGSASASADPVTTTLYAFDLNRLEPTKTEQARGTAVSAQPVPLVSSLVSDRQIDYLLVEPERRTLHAIMSTDRTAGGFSVPLDDADLTVRRYMCRDGPVPESAVACTDYWALFHQHEHEPEDFDELQTLTATDGRYLYRLAPTAGAPLRSWGLRTAMKEPARAVHVRKGGPAAKQLSESVSFLPAQQHQAYPPARCLVPRLDGAHYRPELEAFTEHTLRLRLPFPEPQPNCTVRPPGVRYRIRYAALPGGGGGGPVYSSAVQYSYEPVATIGGLRPYTRYAFHVTPYSYYLDRAQKAAATTTTAATPGPATDDDDIEGDGDGDDDEYYGDGGDEEKAWLRLLDGPAAVATVFSTAAGAPSRPAWIEALPVSPTEAIVRWMAPIYLNNDRVWYEIYWQTETGEHKNRQQQRVTEYNKVDRGLLAMNLTRLQPSQLYRVWIRAHSTLNAFSESESVDIRTFPEPSDIELMAINSTGLRLHWQAPANCIRFQLQYGIVGQSRWTTMFDSGPEPLDGRRHYSPETIGTRYELAALLPKTRYRFVARIYYPDRVAPYLWPREDSTLSFVYETLADRPGAPGRPVVMQLHADLYKVSWEMAKDNGAPLEEYGLEALVRQQPPPPPHRDAIKLVSANGTAVTATNATEQLEATTAEVSGNETTALVTPPTYPVATTTAATPLDGEAGDSWCLVYNGTDTYWIISDRQTINSNLFRVRARNSFGWGPYSKESRPVSHPMYVRRAVGYVMVFTCILAIVLLAVIVVIVCILRFDDKRKAFTGDGATGGSRLPDVELANLRELPRRGNFVTSSNALYGASALLNAEVSLLPQIRSDQIYMASSSLLGSGAFGEVYEGVVKGVDGEAKTRVAIKTLKKGAKEHEKQEFLQEAQLMSNFKHKHITRLLGVCLEADTLLIIMELMRGGDLLSYLRRSRPIPGQAGRLTMLDLISMCQDVAAGCRYLEEMHFVHRDLACRNCLVSSTVPRDRVVKIGDFGLARDIYKNDYYRKEGEGLLPVRWMSPESLIDGVFTSQSDIWSFGVLLWEIMTLGEQPYQAKNNIEVLNSVREGGYLDRPKVCPEAMYELMEYCWNFIPEKRPTFRYCVEVLEKLRANTSVDTHIIAPFPSMLLQPGGEAVSNPSYSVDEVYAPLTPEMLQQLYRAQELDGGGSSIATPPTTSSSNSSSAGATGGLLGVAANIPKYLELLHEDSAGNSHISNPFVNQHHQQHQMMPVTQLLMLMNNGYEIPITDHCAADGGADDGGGVRAMAARSAEGCSSSSKDPLLPVVPMLMPPGLAEGLTPQHHHHHHHHHQCFEEEQLHQLHGGGVVVCDPDYDPGERRPEFGASSITDSTGAGGGDRPIGSSAAAVAACSSSDRPLSTAV